MTEDGSGTNYYEFHLSFISNFTHGEFACKFTSSIYFGGICGGLRGDGASFGDSKNGAGAHVDEAIDAGFGGFFGGDSGAIDIDFPEFIARFCERDECHVMVNDVDAFHGCSHSGTVADIGLNESDLFGAGGIFPDIEDGDLFAAFE